MSVENPVIDYLDTTNKRIYLRSGVREYHPVTDIYSEIRNLRRVDESLRRFDIMVTSAGNIAKGGGKFTPRYAIFHAGWKVVPEDVSHELIVSGEQITDDGESGSSVIDFEILSPGVNVVVTYEPPAAELIVIEIPVDSGSSYTLDEIASSVWNRVISANPVAGSVEARLAMKKVYVRLEDLNIEVD